ncbi:MAG: hypothetical protein ABIN00_02070 [candidate division WOR-3 bacterium]
MRKRFPYVVNKIEPCISLGNISFEFNIDKFSFKELNINFENERKNINKVLKGKKIQTAVKMIPKLSFVQTHHFQEVFSLAVEEIYNVKIPEKSKVFRMIVLEIERISASLLFLSTISSVLGFETFKYWALKDREKILSLLKILTKNENILTDFIVPGGINKRIYNVDIETLLEFFDRYYEKILFDYEKIFFKNVSLISRTKNFGIFDKETLKKNNASGLLLRSCGIKFDLRKSAPYEMYQKVEFPIHPFEVSDVYNRILSLYFEIKNSIKIIKSCLKLLSEISDEDLYNDIPYYEKIDNRFSFKRIEGVNGELSVYVEITDSKIEHIKFTTSSFVNGLLMINKLSGDYSCSDIPLIYSSLYIVPMEVFI